MTDKLLQQQRINNAVDYFRRVDRADPTVLDLFTDDATLYFPKFGEVRGKAGIGAFAQAFGSEIVAIEHDIEHFDIYPSGDVVVVEGREKGHSRSGGAWPDGVLSQGRFCNVFVFEGERIKKLSIYTDPDFNSDDAPRVAWAKSFREALAGPA